MGHAVRDNATAYEHGKEGEMNIKVKMHAITTGLGYGILISAGIEFCFTHSFCVFGAEVSIAAFLLFISWCFGLFCR